MTVAERLLGATRMPLVRNTTALILNTGINGALGLAYWVLAARLYDPTIVGLGAGAVSGLLFTASLGWIGLQQVLLRFLPRAGSQGARLILGVYAAATALALAAGVVFLVYARDQPELAFLVAGPLPAIGFLGAIFIWVVFSLQDPVLIGLGRTAWVPLENLGFGVVKLVLLALAAGFASPWAILGSWILGASWLVLVVSLAIRRRLRTSHGESLLPTRRRLAGFAVGQHLIAVVTAAPDSLVPLIILAILGGEATAFYYAAWTVSFTLRLLAVNLGSVVTVEGSRAGSSVPHLARQVRLLAPIVVLPAVIVLWLLAQVVMSIYGPRYAEASTEVLRLMIVAVVPFTGITLFIAGERIAERTSAALGVALIVTVTTIALDLVLVPGQGVVGAGWAWLAAQMAGLAMCLAIRQRRRMTRT